MRTPLALLAALLLAVPLTGHAQDGRATLEAAAKALGADTLKSLEFSGSGVQLSEADVFTPPPAGTAPPRPSSFTLNFADNLKRLGLGVDRLLPLHGRLVPIADLHTAVSHAH